MADEKLSADQESEQWRLQEMVERIEFALQFSGGMDAATVGLMRRALHNAQQQISRNEADVQRKAEEQKEATERQAMINALVSRETALNSSEKQEYAGFLKKDYFTKKDFAALEHFYAHSWEKLSEGGKDQMSHRVWEGVRRGEFKFEELPKAIKEREAQHIQHALQNGKELPPVLSAMPESARNDFLQARKAGNKEQSQEILSQSSFSKSVSKTHAEKAEGNTAPVLKTAESKAKQPALEQVVAHASMGNKKIVLQDMPSLDEAPANPKPPLPERTGGPAGKGRA